jgi:hypothetical protein
MMNVLSLRLTSASTGRKNVRVMKALAGTVRTNPDSGCGRSPMIQQSKYLRVFRSVEDFRRTVLELHLDGCPSLIRKIYFSNFINVNLVHTTIIDENPGLASTTATM